MKQEIDEIKTLAQTWLDDAYDSEIKKEVSTLLTRAENDPTAEEELVDSFYRKIAFGTGGVRGKMGVGPNRINTATIGLITQGLANYALNNFQAPVKVAIAYDTRNKSQNFARTVAEIFAANGIEVYLFQEPRPTPQLSFSIRHLKCQLGIVITASHNPKEYNGYKVYFEDGAQIVPPWDGKIMSEVEKLVDITEVKFEGGDSSLIHPLGKENDEVYFAAIDQCLFSSRDERKNYTSDILYSSIHGTGSYSVYPCLQSLGFSSVQMLESQASPDGNFPTVVSPNPEERVALELGIKEMQKKGIKLFMATDPDSDRLGVAVSENSKIHLLNGNQIGVLLADYILGSLSEEDKANGYLVRTIVTSPLIDLIAANYQLPIYSVLTGFKFIGEMIRIRKEKGDKYLFGMEESYGYLVSDIVRDKDAVSASAMLCELYYSLESQGITFLDQLDVIYEKYGYFTDSLKSIVKEGKSGAEEIIAQIESYRNQPPRDIAGIKVTKVRDYQVGVERSIGQDTAEIRLGLPPSNVIQFELVDGSLITMRPSGTEPKIKFYFSVRQPLGESVADLAAAKRVGDEKLRRLMQEF